MHSKLIDLRIYDDSIAIVVHYVKVRLYVRKETKKGKLYIQNGIVLCGKVFSTLRHRRTQANNTIFEQRVKRKCFISGNYLMNLCICWIFFLNYDFLLLFLPHRLLGNGKLQSVRNYFIPIELRIGYFICW